MATERVLVLCIASIKQDVSVWVDVSIYRASLSVLYASKVQPAPESKL